PVRRVRRRDAEVEIRPERLERHPAVAVPLAARDLGPAEPPRAGDPDPLRPEPHRALHGLLHCPAERHPLLQLDRDVLGHELRVEFRVHHLLDVEVDLLARPRLELVLELLDLGALAPDDDARPRRVNHDARPVRRALDVDPRDARVVERVLDVPPDLGVLVEEVRVLLPGEPARAPRPRRAEPEANRVDLLPHYALLVVLAGRRPPPRGRRRAALAGRRRADAAPAPASVSATVMWAR